MNTSDDGNIVSRFMIDLTQFEANAVDVPLDQAKLQMLKHRMAAINQQIRTLEEKIKEYRREISARNAALGNATPDETI
ncbi:MAG TPA: hypothetical protein VFO76_10550 [Candidatus Kapabacteria bacterium]|nr:hypothetical protein [Candidatus Kapabacteria bacterium]